MINIISSITVTSQKVLDPKAQIRVKSSVQNQNVLKQNKKQQKTGVSGRTEQARLEQGIRILWKRVGQLWKRVEGEGLQGGECQDLK